MNDRNKALLEIISSSCGTLALPLAIGRAPGSAPLWEKFWQLKLEGVLRP